MSDSTDLLPAPGDDEETLWRKVHDFCAARLGITSILFGFTHSRHLKERVGMSRCLLIRHSHPGDYVDHFGGESFLENDLCALVLTDSLGPFLWHDAARHPDATPAQLEQARIDHEFGMDVGVSLGFEFAGGRGIAGIGLCARHMDPDEFERRWRREGDDVVAYLHRFERPMMAAMVANRLRLSPRQKQVLAYSAGGMLAKEIAAHLGLGENTVYNYLEAARRALKAATSMEAVAKALIYDLI